MENTFVNFENILGNFHRSNFNEVEKYQRGELRKTRLKKRETLQAAICKVIPPLYQTAHLRNLNLNLRHLILSALPEKPLFIWGDVGTGKTYSSMAISRWFLMRHKTVLVWQWNALLLHLRNSFAGNDTSENSLLRPLLIADFLVLDDLAVEEKVSDFSSTRLFMVLDDRLNRRRPTLITSNKPVAAMGKLYGERIYSRLCGHFLEIKLSGSDKRRRRL